MAVELPPPSRRGRPRRGRTRRPARRLVADGRRARLVGRRRPPRPRDRRAAATSTVTAAPRTRRRAAELRSQPDPAEGQEDTMADTAENTPRRPRPRDQHRGPRRRPLTGGLQVEDRVTVTNEPPARARRRVPRRRVPRRDRHDPVAGVRGPRRHLDRLGRQHQQAPAASPAASALDQRYAWPAFARVNVDAGATQRGRVHADRPDARRPPRTSSARSTPSPRSPRSARR